MRAAPAVDVVSTFFTHFDEDIDGFIRSYRGWARWSGTSSAAPKVAAAIAQDMYLHGGSAPALVGAALVVVEVALPRPRHRVQPALNPVCVTETGELRRFR